MAKADMAQFGQPVQISSLPNPGTSGLYFLYRNGRIVYVGQGRNIRARIGAHIAEGLKCFDAISFIPCPIGELLSRERSFIRRLAPEYNQCSVARMAKRPADAARAWLSEHRHD